MQSVLVLNQNYEPLNICNTKRALVLVDGGKAEVLEHGEIDIRTQTDCIVCPPPDGRLTPLSALL